MKKRKGILLAGGSGTRLYPITMGVSKQLLPIYDKPMVYYPLSVLMLAGIQEIAIITTPEDQEQFKSQLRDTLANADAQQAGASVFGYHVADPERYGVVDFDTNGNVKSIIEKPKVPASNYAVTGLYFVDESAPERAKQVKPSPRGELEITSLLESYLDDGSLTMNKMGRGYAWLDTGTHGSLLDAGNFVRTLEKRQGMQMGCPEEIAYENKWISLSDVKELAKKFSKNAYGAYLNTLT